MPVFPAARNRFFYTNCQHGQAGRGCFHRDCPLLTYPPEAPISQQPVMLMQSAASSMCGSSKNPISVYLQLTLVSSAAAWILIIWSGHLNMGYGLMIPAIMWCPGFAVLVTSSLLGRELSSLGWRWPQSKYLAAAYFVPLAYASVAYGAVWALRLGGWNSDFVSLVA